MAINSILPKLETGINNAASAVARTATAVCGASLRTQPRSDVFERTSAPTASEILLRGPIGSVFRLSPFAITKQSLDSMPQERFTQILNNIKLAPFAEQMTKDTICVARYADIFNRALNGIAPDSKLKIISVGQSPAMIVECLALKGIDTAVCPGSGLFLGCRINEFLASSHKEQYYQYLKNFGLDVDNVDKDKIHIFTDYTIRGDSLKNFKRIIEPRLPKNIKTMFVSMNHLVNSEGTPLVRDFVQYFDSRYLKDTKLKDKYSPIFDLMSYALPDIAKIHRNSQYSQKNYNCNQMKFLLYDLLYGKAQVE